MTRQYLRQPLAAAIVLIAAVVLPSSAAAQVPWSTDLAKASASARQTNTPLLIEFWATWCTACRSMDAEVYTQPRVVEAMRKVQPVKVDVDERADLARSYEVAGTPTLVFADSYGNELFRYTGALQSEPMLQLLGELPGDVTAINRLSSALADRKNDPTTLRALGTTLREQSLFRASNRYYARALRASGGRAEAAARADILLAMGGNHLDLREYQEAEKAFKKYLKEHAGGPSEPEAMLGLAAALAGRTRTAEARTVLQSIVRRFAGAPAAAEATRRLTPQ